MRTSREKPKTFKYLLNQIFVESNSAFGVLNLLNFCKLFALCELKGETFLFNEMTHLRLSSLMSDRFGDSYYRWSPQPVCPGQEKSSHFRMACIVLENNSKVDFFLLLLC